MLFLFTVIFGLVCSARATDVIVVQAGKDYLSAEATSKATEINANPSAGKPYILKSLKVKKGDQLVFENLDKVTHNVYGEGFDLEAQAPGQKKTVKIEKVGRQTVRCAIHPKMKIELEVGE